jgi:hypothetical protein
MKEELTAEEHNFILDGITDEQDLYLRLASALELAAPDNTDYELTELAKLYDVPFDLLKQEVDKWF